VHIKKTVTKTKYFIPYFAHTFRKKTIRRKRL